MTALVAGGVVVALPKGTRHHRLAGRVYAGSLGLVNVTAFLVYEITGGLNAFHAMAVLSAVTLAAGLLSLQGRARRRGHFEPHAYFMSWSYVGLVAAGTAQVVTSFTSFPPGLSVWAPTLAVMLVGGFVVHAGVPRAIASMRGERQAPPPSRALGCKAGP